MRRPRKKAEDLLERRAVRIQFQSEIDAAAGDIGESREIR